MHCRGNILMAAVYGCPGRAADVRRLQVRSWKNDGPDAGKIIPGATRWRVGYEPVSRSRSDCQLRRQVPNGKRAAGDEVR